MKATSAYLFAGRQNMRSIGSPIADKLEADADQANKKGDKYSRLGDSMMARYKNLGKTKNYMKGKK